MWDWRVFDSRHNWLPLLGLWILCHFLFGFCVTFCPDAVHILCHIHHRFDTESGENPVVGRPSLRTRDVLDQTCLDAGLSHPVQC